MLLKFTKVPDEQTDRQTSALCRYKFPTALWTLLEHSVGGWWPCSQHTVGCNIRQQHQQQPEEGGMKKGRGSIGRQTWQPHKGRILKKGKQGRAKAPAFLLLLKPLESYLKIMFLF